MGAEGQAFIIGQLFSILPKPAESLGLAESVQRLTVLMHSTRCQISPEDSQILVKQAVECVTKVEAGDSPVLLENPIEDLSKIYSSLQYFLRVPDNDAEGEELVGTAAYEQMFEIVDTATTPEELELVCKWSWMATPSQKTLLHAKRDEINRVVMEGVKKRKAEALEAAGKSVPKKAAKAVPKAEPKKARAGKVGGKDGKVAEDDPPKEVEEPSLTACGSGA